MRHLAFLAVLAIIVILLATSRFLRYQEKALKVSRQSPESDAIVRLENVRIVSRALGVPEWKLMADRIVVRHGGGDLQAFRSVTLHRIREGVLFSKGKPAASFSAGEAVFERNGKTLAASGGIEVDGKKGERLTAVSCILSENDDFIRFPAGARLRSEESDLRAPSLLFAPRRRLVQCPSGAEGRIRGVNLRADALYWDVGSKRVSCPGPVSGARKGQPFFAGSLELDLKSGRMIANDGWVRLRMESDSEVGL